MPLSLQLELLAGDKSRVSVLKPLDIVTTAGSAGNIIAALQTLPGTQTGRGRPIVCSWWRSQ
jgi:hypothetical protein